MSSSNSLIPSVAVVKRQADQGGNIARSSKRFLYVSKTSSRNPQDLAIYLKQFDFKQQET
jgi:hypothetical protein